MTVRNGFRRGLPRRENQKGKPNGAYDMATRKPKKPVKKKRVKPDRVGGTDGLFVVPRRTRVRVRCESCAARTVRHTMDRTAGGGNLLCPTCFARASRGPEYRPALDWYAVTCVPRKEKVARASILKRAKAAGADVKRVLVPKTRTATATKRVWAVFAPGDPPRVLGKLYGEDEQEAFWEAKRKWGDDHPDLSITEYKKGGKYRVSLKKNYPGYVIVQMVWDGKMSPVVEGAKCVTGMVPPRPKFYTKKPYKKGMLARARLPKRFANSKSKKPHDEWLDATGWKPIPLEPAEVEQLLRDERDRAGTASKKPPIRLPYRVGTPVRVVKGLYAGCGGTVGKIHGMPKKARQTPYKRLPQPVTVDVVVRLLGRSTTVTVAWHECVPE